MWGPKGKKVKAFYSLVSSVIQLCPDAAGGKKPKRVPTNRDPEAIGMVRASLFKGTNGSG